MAYQYKREPLSDDATNALANTCESFAEKLVVWTLLDTGLRVSEFAASTKGNVQWQERRLVIHGKGGPYGKRSKRRVIPVADRVRRLIEYHFAEHNEIGVSGRTIQRIVKRVANRAGIAKPVTPHVPVTPLRSTASRSASRRGPCRPCWATTA